MKSILLKILNFISPKKTDPLTKIKFTQHKTQRLGTSYGGWNIPENFLNESSVCVSAGAGEDLSFDVELVKLYGCRVCILDPTPKAVKHFEKFKSQTKRGDKTIINQNPSQHYDVSQKDLNSIHFLNIGLWNKPKKIRFYSPQNPGHASYSAVNLQKTDNYVYGKVDRLSNVMKKLDLKRLALLKLDIEGAEYKVVETIIEDKLDINLICLEYDEVNSPLDDEYKLRIKDSLNLLVNYGYAIIYSDLKGTYTLMKDNPKNRSKLSKQSLLSKLLNIFSIQR